MSVRDRMFWPGHGRNVARYGRGQLGSLQQEFDRLVEEFFGVPERAGESASRRFAMTPDIDVAETKDGFEITAELPGVDEKDVEVTVADGVLSLRGEKKAETEEKEKNFYRAERLYGAFQRSVSLPLDVDEEKVEAAFKNGVLTVKLPRNPDAKAASRRIEVKAA